MKYSEIEERVFARMAAGAAGHEEMLYVARVVIHVPDEDSRAIYEDLHDDLAAVGFHKAITVDGIGYELPDGVYAKNGTKGQLETLTSLVTDVVSKAAKDPEPEVLVLAVQDVGLAGLKRVKKSAIKQAEVLIDPKEA